MVGKGNMGDYMCREKEKETVLSSLKNFKVIVRHFVFMSFKGTILH